MQAAPTLSVAHAPAPLGKCSYVKADTDPLKATMIPYMPDIIATGKHEKNKITKTVPLPCLHGSFPDHAKRNRFC